MRRILLVDDHEVVRDGVRRILDKHLGATTFGEASTDAEALRLARNEDWDVAVVDLAMDGRDGLEILKELKQMRPLLPILILSMHKEEVFARRALKAGAAGYVTKGSTRSELVQAVDKVIRGGIYVSPSLAEQLATDLRAGTNRQPHESLSDREFEVLRLIGAGKTVGEIAHLLSLSVATISTHRARLLEKMGMKTNAELTRYAVLNDLVD